VLCVPSVPVAAGRQARGVLVAFLSGSGPRSSASFDSRFLLRERERERESKLLWGKEFSRQTDAATQGSSSSSSSVAAGSRDQGGRRGRRVSDKDYYYYYYYYSFDSLMCVIRRVDRKKLAVQQSSLTA
jgi:hypothetical protein